MQGGPVTTEVSAPASEAYLVPTATLGLRQHVLSPVETLAQSISTIAPSTTPLLTVPVVFAVGGSAWWVAYLLALTCMVLISLCIAVFSGDSASPC